MTIAAASMFSVTLWDPILLVIPGPFTRATGAARRLINYSHASSYVGVARHDEDGRIVVPSRIRWKATPRAHAT